MIRIPDDLRKETERVSKLVPYAGNAKRHPDWQVEQIANSIEAFGFNDPIAVWEDVAGHLVVVEGHGRLLAAKMLGMDEVPIIRLDHLDDEARRAYTLAHNKLTMNTDFDFQVLASELDAIEGWDMDEFGFDEEAPKLDTVSGGNARGRECKVTVSGKDYLVAEDEAEMLVCGFEAHIDETGLSVGYLRGLFDAVR